MDHSRASRSRLHTPHHLGSRDSLRCVSAQCTHEAARMVVRATPLGTLGRSAELAVAPKRLSEECQRPAAHVRTMVPSPSKEQRGSTEGVCFLRRIRQTGRHVGSNSERWSGHTRDRKRQRPALNAGARPRALWKNGNRAVSVSRKERNLNKHLEGLVRLTEALVQSTLTSSQALS